MCESGLLKHYASRSMVHFWRAFGSKNERRRLFTKSAYEKKEMPL
jgi:hypothetical protein